MVGRADRGGEAEDGGLGVPKVREVLSISDTDYEMLLEQSGHRCWICGNKEIPRTAARNRPRRLCLQRPCCP